MVMDEDSRNGWKLHLAQQIVQPVIRYVLSSIPCDHDYHTDIGDFYFSYKYQKFPPVSNYNNLQFVNK